MSQVKVITIFERICRFHVALASAIGVLIYTQRIKDVIVVLGVQNESAHSLRNTGLLLILAAFISACVLSGLLRGLMETLGNFLVRSDTDKTKSFVAGLAATSNLILLVHYTFEAFFYENVAKIAVILAWTATVFAACGISVSVDVTKKSD